MPMHEVPVLGQLQMFGACTCTGFSMGIVCRQLRPEAVLAATSGALCRPSPARLHRRPQSACSPAECDRHQFQSKPQKFPCFQEYRPPLGCSLDGASNAASYLSLSPASHLLGQCSLGANRQRARSEFLSINSLRAYFQEILVFAKAHDGAGAPGLIALQDHR